MSKLDEFGFFLRLLQLLCRLAEVSLTDDVVTIENAPGLVSADGHGYAFRYASTHHVADGCAAQIVKK